MPKFRAYIPAYNIKNNDLFYPQKWGWKKVVKGDEFFLFSIDF